jgi:hypothetical protein
MAEQDDLYGGGSDMPNEAPAEKEDRKEAGESGKTYLINKDVCPDMQVGDEMVVKIEAIHEGEYEVSYSEEKPTEQESETSNIGSEASPSQSESMYG